MFRIGLGKYLNRKDRKVIILSLFSEKDHNHGRLRFTCYDIILNPSGCFHALKEHLIIGLDDYEFLFFLVFFFVFFCYERELSDSRKSFSWLPPPEILSFRSFGWLADPKVHCENCLFNRQSFSERGSLREDFFFLQANNKIRSDVLAVTVSPRRPAWLWLLS